MEKLDFPIGSELKQIVAVEECSLGADKFCIYRVQLVFDNEEICLAPSADTDEIEIELKNTDTRDRYCRSELVPDWGEAMIGKKLRRVWISENNQGDRNQIGFALVHPILISFLQLLTR